MNLLLGTIFLVSLGCVYSSVPPHGTPKNNCPEESKVIFCYYAGWAVYRPRGGNLTVENIDHTLCTHLVYAFAGLSIDGVLKSLDPENDLDGGKGAFRRFANIKEKNPCIKTLLAIGGWNENPEKYSVMSESAENRKLFGDGILRYLVEFGFDGLDVDWEYPTMRGGIAADKENFVKVMKLLHDMLSTRGKLLTVAVGANENVIDQAYDIPGICQSVDYVLLMSYEYQMNDITSLLAPLHREDDEPQDFPTVARSIKKWLDGGCPAKKVVMGVSTFAKTYTLESPDPNNENNGLGLPNKGPGIMGNLTLQEGFLGYNEVCLLVFDSKTWYVGNRPKNACKYATKGDQWMTYDDPETATIKAKYAMELNLGGVMIWSLDTDDFYGFCHDDASPIIVAVNKVLRRDLFGQKRNYEL